MAWCSRTCVGYALVSRALACPGVSRTGHLRLVWRITTLNASIKATRFGQTRLRPRDPPMFHEDPDVEEESPITVLLWLEDTSEVWVWLDDSELSAVSDWLSDLDFSLLSVTLNWFEFSIELVRLPSTLLSLDSDLPSLKVCSWFWLRVLDVAMDIPTRFV